MPRMLMRSGQYYMKGMKDKISNGSTLYDGGEVFISTFWLGERSYIDDRDIFFNLGKPLQWTFQVPDSRDTVIKFELQKSNK